MERIRMQEDNLGILVRNSGFKFTDTFFPYTSGQIGPYYVNSEVVMKNGGDYCLAVRAVAELICDVIEPYEFDVVSGGESRDWIFSNPVALSLQKPHLSIYKDGKTIGADVKGKRVVHVADLNNEGSSPRNTWIPTIRNAGGRIENIFFYVDRLEDGVGVMKDLGLRSEAVVPLDGHAWDFLKEQNILDEQTYKNLNERMEDKDAWARAMLGSEVGRKRFKELYESPKTCDKAMKILDVGYPDMKEEIVNRLGFIRAK